MLVLYIILAFSLGILVSWYVATNRWQLQTKTLHLKLEQSEQQLEETKSVLEQTKTQEFLDVVSGANS